MTVYKVGAPDTRISEGRGMAKDGTLIPRSDITASAPDPTAIPVSRNKRGH